MNTYYIITIRFYQDENINYLTNDLTLGSIENVNVKRFIIHEEALKTLNEIKAVQYSPYLMRTDVLGRMDSLINHYITIVKVNEDGSTETLDSVLI